MTDSVIEGLPRYFEPIRHLGEGGMGVVWSVRDTRVNKIGALKVIRPKHESSPTSLMRFEREIRNFAQLIHPYIVQVYDVGQMTTGEPYIFMEQVNGKPISAAMLRNRSFDEIAMLIDRILEGLDEAHANNLIHRDLKPDNILITEDEAGTLLPKIMDFGLALRADESDLRITCDGMVVGTPIYMAPEQACDEHFQICPATDFYGFGCILYELFSGQPPFTGSNAVNVMIAQAKEKPKPFSPLPEFSETIRLSSIIMRLLEKLPDRRFDTAADLRAALRRQFIIRDNQIFGTNALKSSVDDTVVDFRADDSTPFMSTQLAPQSYKTILPNIEHCKYNYSVLSLRPPMFVGRSNAKYLLTRYLKDVFQCRRTAITMITGKPGVGKSRFVESFAQDCYKKGTATSLFVDGTSCTNLRFAIYQSIFAKLLLKTLTEEQVELALCRFIQTNDKNDARVRALEDIFAAEMDDKQPPIDKMDHVLCDVFAKLTRTKPLILCFDNIAPEQLPDLTAITRELTVLPQIKLPILICVVNTTTNGMPTDIELALGNENALWLRRSIAIEPLSNAAMKILITQSLSISDELSGFIETLSSGLPQIAVTLARQWQLAGILQPTANGYIANQPPDQLPIPKCVHEEIMRIIHLTFVDYAKRTWLPVISIAALFGATFTPKTLAKAIEFIPTKQKLISYSTFISLGLAGGVLVTVNNTTLAFSNHLMHEALFATLKPYEIQDYHHAIAQALKTLPNTTELQIQIASHLYNAAQYDDAFRAYLELAKIHTGCGEFDTALEDLDRAQDAIKQRLGFADSRAPEVAEIWFVEADIYLQKNDIKKASLRLKWLEYANQTEEYPERRAAFKLLQSSFAQLENDETLAITCINQSLEILNALHEPLSHEQLEILFSALVQKFQFDPSVATKLIDTAKRLKNPIFVDKALLAIATHNLKIGETARAQRFLNMAIDTAHKSGDIRTEATALEQLAKLQMSNPDVCVKTLLEASFGFEKIADFKELANIHQEIARQIASNYPDEAAIHLRWSRLLAHD